MGGEKLNLRNMFNSIFNKDQFSANDNNEIYTNFRMLNSLDNVFSNWNGNIYDDATVRACIDSIAKNAAKLKPKHIRRNNGKILETNSTIDSLLGLRPNEYMSTYDFLYKVVSQLYTYNNEFIYIKTDKTGNIVGLYPLNYSDISLKEYNNVLYCKFNFLSGSRITVPYTELIHLRRHFNREDFYGEANDKPMKSTINILQTVKQGLVNAVKNCTKLRGYIKYLGNLSPKDLKAKTDVFINQFLDSSKSSGIASLDNTSEFHQLTSDIQTADHSQMDFVREDIYRYFGTNESIIKAKYTEDEWNAFYESVLEPLAVQLSLEFTAKLFTEREKGHGNEVVFEANRLQYSSVKTKISLIQTLYPMGILTVNEAREIMNLAAVDGGDKRQISLNYVNANKQDLYQLGKDDNKKDKGADNNGTDE